MPVPRCSPTAMKQTTKTIIHSVSHLLLFGGVILAVASLEQPTESTPLEQPTRQTSADNSVASTVSAPQTHASVRVASSNTTKALPSSLSPKHDSITAAVQREYVYHMFSAPNDPQYSGDWTLTRVNAPAAWNIATGNGSTTVAVIDGGFALAHEDLASRWFTNSGEAGMTQSGGRCWTGTTVDKQTNSCDDDNNGYIDDWRGWSFTQHDNNPQTGRQNPNGVGTTHGTEVTGLVGAAGNNGVGNAAINWNTKIMPLQVLDDAGIGYTSGVTSAVYYAVDNGAQVINLSLGAYADDPAMKAAVTYATNHNVVVVAASGNCGDGSGSECVGVPAGTVAYPAAYPDTIAVGATTASNLRASFSSYGQSIDVSAPGYAIPSSPSWSAANPTSLYSSPLYGTSFSSPQVASLVALIKSIRPSSSIGDITALIDATATKPAAMNGLLYSPQFGHGIINAGSALTIANTLNATATVTPTLAQVGSFQSEHTTPAGTTLGTGCQISNGNACVIQLFGSSGYKRYLPYQVASVSGSVGWTWSSDMLDADSWEIRARRGDSVSTTPYYLLKKG